MHFDLRRCWRVPWTPPHGARSARGAGIGLRSGDRRETGRGGEGRGGEPIGERGGQGRHDRQGRLVKADPQGQTHSDRAATRKKPARSAEKKSQTGQKNRWARVAAAAAAAAVAEGRRDCDGLDWSEGAGVGQSGTGRGREVTGAALEHPITP